MEESSERIMQSPTMTRPEESEKEVKLDKMETRDSSKIDQDKSEVKVTPTKEKGKKEVITVKEEKTKDKTTPKNNGKEIEKLLMSPVKVEDEKELKPNTKIGKTEDKENLEKAFHVTERIHRIYHKKVELASHQDIRRTVDSVAMHWAFPYKLEHSDSSVPPVPFFISENSNELTSSTNDQEKNTSETKGETDDHVTLCQEHVPASPLGNECAEKLAAADALLALSKSKWSGILVQSIAESLNYAERSHSTKDTEDEDKVEDIDATSEIDEKLEEDIFLLLCQEHVPASPLGNESAEKLAAADALLALSKSKRSGILVQSTAESLNYAERSLSTKDTEDEDKVEDIDATSEIDEKLEEDIFLLLCQEHVPASPLGNESAEKLAAAHALIALSEPKQSDIPVQSTTESPNYAEQSLSNELPSIQFESDDYMSLTEESVIVFLANQAASRKKIFPSKTVSLSKRPSENNDILPTRKKARKLEYSSEPFSSKPKSSSKWNKGEQKNIDVPSTAENSNMDFVSSDTTSTQTVRTSKYNFCVPLDKTMDSDERIALIQEGLSDIKKAYMNLKREVSKIDRRLEKAKTKRESAAAPASTVNTLTQKDNSDGS